MENKRDSILLVGIDKNLKSAERAAFVKRYEALGLDTVWHNADCDTPKVTTCNARTILQPQGHKSIPYEERLRRADKEEKDLILFDKTRMHCLPGSEIHPNPLRDNTGRLEFKDQIFPTTEFPSDHCILAAELQLLSNQATRASS